MAHSRMLAKEPGLVRTWVLTGIRQRHRAGLFLRPSMTPKRPRIACASQITSTSLAFIGDKADDEIARPLDV